ncbi:MAG: YceD family protein [Chloroflexota bacterium]
MALQYNVAQFLKTDVGHVTTFDFQSDALMELDEAAVAGAIRGHAKFILTNLEILAQVDASAILHLTCARCLEPFRTPVTVDFEEEFQPSVDILTGSPLSAPSSDVIFTLTQNHTLDLREPLRQNLLLAIDMIPLCSGGCKGLCPTCGTNLNENTCACPTPEDPNPFRVLQELLTESDR